MMVVMVRRGGRRRMMARLVVMVMMGLLLLLLVMMMGTVMRAGVVMLGHNAMRSPLSARMYIATNFQHSSCETIRHGPAFGLAKDIEEVCVCSARLLSVREIHAENLGLGGA